MYISKEQKELSKIDAEFRKLVKEAENFTENTLKRLEDWRKHIYIDELNKAKKPTFKSKRLKIKDNVLLKSCSPFETIFIPKGVVEIGEEAFKGGKNATIVFPDGLKKIGANAFKDVTTLFRMDVKDIELCYPAEAFYLVREGEEIDQFSKGFSQLPSTLEEIGDYAFQGCGKESYLYYKQTFEYLILPKALKRIGKAAFMDCGIKAVYIAGPETVSESCFSGSRRLVKVILGDKIKKIGKLAFDGCGELEKVVFSKNLQEIDECAFSGCVSIKKITLADTLKKIGKYGFCECKKITSVIIPNSVTEIGERTFFKCENISKVKIGEGLTIIPPECFGECKKLIEVEIPSSVTYIASDAFKNCKKLIIRATRNSYAEQYAKEKNIKFVAI